ERRNLASARESTRVAMRNALERLTAGAPIDAPGTVSAEARERLRALGYVGSAPPAASSSATEWPDPKDNVQVLERYRAAIALVRQGRFDAALSDFRTIVRDNPLMG